MNRRKRHRRTRPPGTPPGTITTDPQAPPPVMRVFAFDGDRLAEYPVKDVHEVNPFLAEYPVTWLDVSGIGNAETIRSIGEVFHIHPLALEDSVHMQQRAKVEAYDAQLFIVARTAGIREHLETEQISFFLGGNYVVTIQEGLPGDPFEPVRDRVRRNVGHIRKAGADYLAYALLDAVIDGYFPAIEEFGERLETIEASLLTRPGRGAMARLYEIKRELLTLRRAAWPLREAMNALVRDPNALIGDDARLHLRDCYDHTVRIIDFVETYRELASDLTDVYLSSASHRMNEVMKVLTIIATIFIPVTFIASLYGMNFNTERSPFNMPELSWYLGYPFALAMMAAIAVVMLVYFWRKGWLSSDNAPNDGDHEAHGSGSQQ